MLEWALNIDPKAVTLMQFASSTLLAATSIIVGLVALHFGYRNNFGWKPIILSREPYLAELRTEGMMVGISFEVWNRQKYPVVLRQMRISFGTLKLLETVSGKEEGWMVTAAGQIVHKYRQHVLEPNEHETFAVQVRFEPEGKFEDFVGPEALVSVQIFDPKRNKTY